MTDSLEKPNICQDQIFYFGGLKVDPTRNLLRKGHESFNIEPRIMSVLCVLASHAREVVPRETLIETIWNVEFGADESLTRAISILRKTFREAGEPDGHIETIPKNGYRLTTTISHEVPASQILDFANQTQPASSRATLSPDTEVINEVSFSLKKTILTISILIGISIAIVMGLKSIDTRIGADLGTGKGRSVAILSFTDMSAGKTQEYFSDGITEEIFTSLADIPNLRIAARNSSFSYKGKPTDMRTIGEDLNVSHIIDGSIRTQGDKIRVTAQLINTQDGLHVWTKSYDGMLDETFAVQERVSQDIVFELRNVLTIGLEDVRPIELGSTPAPPDTPKN